MASYKIDQVFGHIFRALNGNLPSDETKKLQLEKIIHTFRNEVKRLMYANKLCVLRTIVSDVLQLAHDSKISGHSAFAKTLSKLAKYHWRPNTRDFVSFSRMP